MMFDFFTGAFSFPEHRAPTFTTEPPNKVIYLNSSGESVHCAAMGNPRPTISWVLSDGTTVQDLPGLRLALANGTLLFLPFMAESYRQDVHASTYRCIASNLVGKIGSRDIRVRAGKFSLYFSLFLIPKNLSDGTPVKSCFLYEKTFLKKIRVFSLKNRIKLFSQLTGFSLETTDIYIYIYIFFFFAVH